MIIEAIFNIEKQPCRYNLINIINVSRGSILFRTHGRRYRPRLRQYELNLLTALKDLGAAYGTAKSGIGIASMGVMKPDMIMKSIVPIIMAGILGIYGLIVAVILLQKSKGRC